MYLTIVSRFIALLFLYGMSRCSTYVFNAITLQASQSQLHTGFRTLNDCIAKGKLSYCRPGQAIRAPGCWGSHNF